MTGRLLVVALLSTAVRGLPAANLTAPPAGASQQASSARDSVLEAQTTMLAAELRCPVCQGNSIQDSPSELAQQMRDLIRDQLRSGKTPDEVRAYFVDKYGEWILLAPKATGFNLVVYVVPFVALLVGGYVVWRTVRRSVSVTNDAAVSSDQP
ncbi:MAG TPA: cytochrome c-type biogenesis protein [Gemmatimonadaceae bacterium]